MQVYGAVPPGAILPSPPLRPVATKAPEQCLAVHEPVPLRSHNLSLDLG